MGDADIPVGLHGAVATLQHRRQLHCETDGTQDVLELRLLFVAAIGGVGECTHHFAITRHVCPEFVVVEIRAVRLATGVIDVLYVNENTDLVDWHMAPGTGDAF